MFHELSNLRVGASHSQRIMQVLRAITLARRENTERWSWTHTTTRHFKLGHVFSLCGCLLHCTMFGNTATFTSPLMNLLLCEWHCCAVVSWREWWWTINLIHILLLCYGCQLVARRGWAVAWRGWAVAWRGWAVARRRGTINLIHSLLRDRRARNVVWQGQAISCRRSTIDLSRIVLLWDGRGGAVARRGWAVARRGWAVARRGWAEARETLSSTTKLILHVAVAVAVAPRKDNLQRIVAVAVHRILASFWLYLFSDFRFHLDAIIRALFYTCR